MDDVSTEPCHDSQVQQQLHYVLVDTYDQSMKLGLCELFHDNCGGRGSVVPIIS